MIALFPLGIFEFFSQRNYIIHVTNKNKKI